MGFDLIGGGGGGALFFAAAAAAAAAPFPEVGVYGGGGAAEEEDGGGGGGPFLKLFDGVRDGGGIREVDPREDVVAVEAARPMLP